MFVHLYTFDRCSTALTTWFTEYDWVLKALCCLLQSARFPAAWQSHQCHQWLSLVSGNIRGTEKQMREKVADTKEQLTLIPSHETHENRWKARGLNQWENNRKWGRFKQLKYLWTEQFIPRVTWLPHRSTAFLSDQALVLHELWFNRCFRNQDCVSHHFLIFTSHVQSQEINLTSIS